MLTLCGLAVMGSSRDTSAQTTPEEEPAVKAVAKVMPAVVNINTERVVRQATTYYDSFYRKYRTPAQKVTSLGSGLLISPEGYIVTNAHVAEMADNLKISVTLNDGSVYQAKLINSDPARDLALIKIDDKKPFPFVATKTLSPNLLGQTVIALGNPVGYQNSVSRGILSAKNRALRTEEGNMEGLLQTDAAINPGNSGGPLVDIAGNLVGINTAKFSGQSIEGIGFAIPAEAVVPWTTDQMAIARGEKKAPEPVAMGEIMKKKFGISFQPLTNELADAFGYTLDGGLVVTSVEADSPASRAGLQRGMLIVRIGNVAVQSEAAIPRELEKVRPGVALHFTVVVVEDRGGIPRQRGAVVPIVAR
ncbi:MAG TPA: trypsin-like peptidase domain-containing protein [Candidatus Methylacidiphilales bacterium]|nr:trypsin-like peptidase domain-containing protein [Candidatus Methylacidiphilales bacterium]